MVSLRRKELLAGRRRVEDEGEEEGGPDAGELDDDSLSETSALSDLDDEDGDAEGSEISEQEDVKPEEARSSKPSVNGHISAKPDNGPLQTDKTATDGRGDTQAGRTDTEAMLHGLAVPKESAEVEEVQFEEMDQRDSQEQSGRPPQPAQPVVVSSESPMDRRRREQDEYRKKRDADPTFVPNRGGFFMHDHRHAGPAANGFRPFGRGHGRGARAAVGGPHSPANHASQPPEPADAPWSHDLHETVARPSPQPPHGPAVDRGNPAGARPMPPPPNPSAPIRSFSKSTHIGNTQVRVYITGMAEPITFSAVPVQQHTRLPHHRPPLRRDKPVRVSLPDTAPRYVFPATERSFIFIPRALRPNQQGYGRRGDNRGAVGPYRGFNSRRTSAYAGSAYSSSVAMSRRSSLAQELNRGSLISPSGSTMSRNPGPPSHPNKPVVRLPPSMQPQQPPPGPMLIGQGPVPRVSLPYHHDHSGSQDPTLRENRAASIPMHQPRPQKNVSVADIESPEAGSYPQPPQQQQQQPFYHQVPNQLNGQAYPADPSYHPHSRHPSYPSQHSSGTPLSGIPERAIHAQPFQPQPYQQASYYPQPYGMMQAPGAYYYPAPPPPMQYAAPLAPSAVGAPAFLPGGAPAFVPGGAQQGSYGVPVAPAAAAAAAAAALAPGGQQGGTMAQESNGMVYYYDSSQLPPANTSYAAAGYQSGLSNMMTPSPDGYYYPPPAPGPVYYGH